MTKSEKFQQQRADAARQWLASPEYKIEMKRDAVRRAQADRSVGHLPQCGLLKCHPNCSHA